MEVNSKDDESSEMESEFEKDKNIFTFKNK